LAGIYIHIPFCKQACHYCNFHFSTSLKNKNDIIEAMLKEIYIRSKEYNGIVETIYFGGGTPSLLDIEEISKLIETVFKNFKTSSCLEITLEANPDDLSELKLKELSTTKINRLSIGVQSFVDNDLKMMNRAHKSNDSKKCIENAKNYYDNISIDLIYGIPKADLKNWEYNLDLAIEYNTNHISAYALTVEPNTVLEKQVQKGRVKLLNEERVFDQYKLMFNKLTSCNYINYELSSFAKEGYFSKNNSSYWLRKKYIGIGPSAHSFDGKSRSWNISNNKKYIDQIKKGKSFYKKEKLSKVDQYNEYVMTGFRTIWGVSANFIENNFNSKFKNYFTDRIQKHIDQKNIIVKDDIYTTTNEGRFLADGISSDLFLVNLK